MTTRKLDTAAMLTQTAYLVRETNSYMASLVERETRNAKLEDEAQDELERFLAAHGYCKLRLYREGKMSSADFYRDLLTGYSPIDASGDCVGCDWCHDHGNDNH